MAVRWEQPRMLLEVTPSSLKISQMKKRDTKNRAT